MQKKEAIIVAKSRIRNKKIEFYMTEEEREIIDKKAKEIGLNRSEYLRKIAMQGYIIKQDFSHVDDLIYEVNKIGTNINQITKKINETGRIENQDTKRVKELVEEIWNKIGDVL